MDESKFLMNLIECLNFPFDIANVDYLNDSDDTLVIVMKDGTRFTFAIEDIRQTMLLNKILSIAPFKSNEVKEVEENCGSVWVTLESGKVYSFIFIECAAELEQ